MRGRSNAIAASIVASGAGCKSVKENGARLILINAISGDAHAEAVVNLLEQKGASYRCCDFRRFPADVSIGASWSKARGIIAQLELPDVCIALEEVTAVWWDRANFLSKLIKPAKTDLPSYIAAESQTFLDGVYHLIPHALWVSPPALAKQAHNTNLSARCRDARRVCCS